LFYNYYRSYQATQGRYTQNDPIGLAGGSNRYGYVGGNALSYTDPMGLQSNGGRGENIPALSVNPLFDRLNRGLDGGGPSWGGNSFPRGGPPRDPGTANFTPLPGAVGPHTTLGTRSGRSGDYTQGATFDATGRFTGRTDVTNHGRRDHTNPHFHPATGPNSVGSAQMCER
jgi:uncharacterized protein RhaS with RHS repeats